MKSISPIDEIISPAFSRKPEKIERVELNAPMLVSFSKLKSTSIGDDAFEKFNLVPVKVAPKLSSRNDIQSPLSGKKIENGDSTPSSVPKSAANSNGDQIFKRTLSGADLGKNSEVSRSVTPRGSGLRSTRSSGHLASNGHFSERPIGDNDSYNFRAAFFSPSQKSNHRISLSESPAMNAPFHVRPSLPPISFDEDAAELARSEMDHRNFMQNTVRKYT